MPEHRGALSLCERSGPSRATGAFHSGESHRRRVFLPPPFGGGDQSTSAIVTNMLGRQPPPRGGRDRFPRPPSTKRVERSAHRGEGKPRRWGSGNTAIGPEEGGAHARSGKSGQAAGRPDRHFERVLSRGAVRGIDLGQPGGARPVSLDCVPYLFLIRQVNGQAQASLCLHRMRQRHHALAGAVRRLQSMEHAG